MMDKKVILAFALSVAVFVLYSFFLAPQEPLKPSTSSPGQPSGKPIIDSQVATPAVTAASATPAKPTATSMAKPTKDITVKTRWFEAVFSEQGGALKSLRLTAYKERLHEQALKELIHVQSVADTPSNWLGLITPNPP